MNIFLAGRNVFTAGKTTFFEIALIVFTSILQGAIYSKGDSVGNPLLVRLNKF
jgi:hypothetical protein